MINGLKLQTIQTYVARPGKVEMKQAITPAEPMNLDHLKGLISCGLQSRNEEQRLATEAEIERLELQADYPSSLLKVCAMDPDITTRMSALICLRTYFATYMGTGKRRAFKKFIELPPDVFGEVRAQLIDFRKLDNLADPLRKYIDEILATVCIYRFPNNAEEFLLFLKESLEVFAAHAKEGKINPVFKNRVKLGAKVFQAIHQNGVQVPGPVFLKIVEFLFPSLVSAWETVSTNIKSFCQAGNYLGIQTSTALDRLFVQILLCSAEAQNTEVVNICFQKLFEKSQTVLSILRELGQNPQANTELREMLNKDALILLYDYAKVINKAPFALAGNNLVRDLSGLAFEVLKIEWPELTLTKTSLLILHSFLKQYVYYCDPTQYVASRMNIRTKTDPAVQVAVRQQFMEFYGREAFCQELISMLILKIMNKEEFLQEGEKTIDSEIEDSEVSGIDLMSEELELSPKRISISILELLTNRFPDLCLPLITFLMQSIIDGGLKDADKKVKDNVIFVAGMLPSLHRKSQRPEGLPDIQNFLRWFSQQSQQYVHFSRLYSMLIRQWFDFLTPETRGEAFPQLVNLMNHNDPITRYSALRTLSEMVDKDSDATMNYTQIHDLIAPVIVNMCNCVNLPHLIWPLFKTLSTVMERMQSQGNFVPFQYIQQLNFKHILEKEDHTVKQGIIEVFRKMVVSVPFGTPIDYVFEAGCGFLELILPKIASGETTELVFWKFMVKEISKNQGNQPLLHRYAELFQKYWVRFSNFTDSAQICEALSLVDEYFLLLGELPFNLLEFLQNQLDTLETRGLTLEHITEVKGRILTLYTSVFLTSLQAGETGFLAQLEGCLQVCCQGIVTDFEGKGAGPIGDFKTQCATLFSRFLMLKTGEVIDYVKSKMDLAHFLAAWTKSINHITSKKATRMNSFALLTAIRELPLESLYPILPQMIEQTFTDINFEKEGGLKVVENNTTPLVIRIRRLNNFSYRKEGIRKSQLFEDTSLHIAFKDTMVKLKEKLSAAGVEFPATTPQFQERLTSLMSQN